MYSKEIEELLKKKNYLVTVKEYLDIVNSPQVREIYYKDNNFYLVTSDGYNFSLKINQK